MIRSLLIDLPASACWSRLLGANTHSAESTEPAHHIRIDLLELDQQELEFPDEEFDSVTCQLGLSLVPRARQALSEWRRVLKPGGNILSTGFCASALSPLLDFYSEQLFEYGLTAAAGRAIFPWRRFAHPEAVGRLVRSAGFTDVNVTVEQVGRYAPDVSVWWDLMRAAGLLFPLKAVSATEADTFKNQYLREVGFAATSAGVWLDLPIASVVARK